MRTAKERGADVAHFSELCLSGYAGSDFRNYDDFDWDQLKLSTRKIINFAGKLKLWVILGSTHRLNGKHKPHNSLYIINAHGNVIDRYDKMFCTGDKSEKTGDLEHYSPGSHFCEFRIKELKCGVLICHDFRYPELYREYKRRGVSVIFNSHHNGHESPKDWKQSLAYIGRRHYCADGNMNRLGIIVPSTMQTRATSNFMWISVNNTSAKESDWASFFVEPDGVITGRLIRNRAGVLISTVDTKAAIYDASEDWRDRLMLRGVCHSGTLVKDRRSAIRTVL